MDETSAILLGGFITTFLFVLCLANYLLSAFMFYGFAKKINIDCKWIAFIPIAQYYIFFKAINKNMAYILLMLIPVADIVLAIIWQVQFFHAFGQSAGWLWFYLLPGVGGLVIFIYEFYMAYSKNVRYVGLNN